MGPVQFSHATGDSNNKITVKPNLRVVKSFLIHMHRMNFSAPIHAMLNPPRAMSAPFDNSQSTNHRLSPKVKMTDLKLTRLDNGWLLVVVNLAASAASGLKSTDNTHGLFISDLAEDNVLAIEPSGDNGGNEELGAVARKLLVRIRLDG